MSIKNQTLRTLALAPFLLFVPAVAIPSVMSGAHYSILTSVVSGGGSRMASTSYVVTGTLGQPSPLGAEAGSDFELYAGFWECVSLEQGSKSFLPAIYLLLLGDTP